jgi:hypothetical protein
MLCSLVKDNARALFKQPGHRLPTRAKQVTGKCIAQVTTGMLWTMPINSCASFYAHINVLGECVCDRAGEQSYSC